MKYSSLEQQSSRFWAPETGFLKDNFSIDPGVCVCEGVGGGGGWFQDDSSTLHLLCPTFINLSASLVTQMLKNLPAMQENQVWSLVRKIPWRREWQPTPIFLPGQFHGQRAWWARVLGVTMSLTKLSNYHFLHLLKTLM